MIYFTCKGDGAEPHEPEKIPFKKYRIILPEGMGPDLYTDSFIGAKEMVKEYGKGTQVITLTIDDALKQSKRVRCPMCGVVGLNVYDDSPDYTPFQI